MRDIMGFCAWMGTPMPKSPLYGYGAWSDFFSNLSGGLTGTTGGGEGVAGAVGGLVGGLGGAVLPAVVGNLLGPRPGATTAAPTPTQVVITPAAKAATIAGLSLPVLAAIGIGAYFLLGKKR